MLLKREIEIETVRETFGISQAGTLQARYLRINVCTTDYAHNRKAQQHHNFFLEKVINLLVERHGGEENREKKETFWLASNPQPGNFVWKFSNFDTFSTGCVTNFHTIMRNFWRLKKHKVMGIMIRDIYRERGRDHAKVIKTSCP